MQEFKDHPRQLECRRQKERGGGLSGAWVMVIRVEAPKAFLRLFLAILAGGVLLAAAILPFAGAGGWMVNASTDTMNSSVKDISENNTVPLRSRITDRNGKTIAWVYNQNRTEVPSDKISQAMKDSIVAIEDRRFYEHEGVDIRGTLRAAVANISSGGVSEGASTINQQYVKNYLWLISAENEDQAAEAIETSLPRKLREMKMAGQLDKKLTKDEILTRYLNLVSFGNSAFGVQAAAQTYFGVNAADLNDNQAAFLAGIVQSTSALDPYTNPDGAKDRRNAVLQARVNSKTLSQSEADALAKKPLGVLKAPKIPTNGCIGAGGSGFFCDYVLEYLDKKGIPKDEITKGGYTIRTTLDPKAQESAEKAARSKVSPTQEGVSAATDYLAPKDGMHQVLAMASSRKYGLNQDKQQTVLPLTHSMQGHGAGSVFKIFAAAAAMEDGMGLNTNLAVPARAEVEGMGAGGARGCPPGKYCVENAGSYKPNMTLKEALATSPNTPFVEMAEKIGMKRIVDIAIKLGLRSYKEKGSFDGEHSVEEYIKDNNLGSFVLGPTAVDPLELSNVAASLADHGRWCEPLPVLGIKDRNGKKVDFDEAKCEQAIDKDIADALANGMGSDVQGGTAAASARATGWSAPVSAKTGTTETSFSAAFLGFTPGWAGSSYIFNDGGTAKNLCTAPVRQCGNGNLYGGNEPAQIFFETSKPVINKYGGGKLPSYNKKYDAGTNPGKWGAPVANTGGGGTSTNNAAPPQTNTPPPEINLPPEVQRGLNDLNDLLRQFQ